MNEIEGDLERAAAWWRAENASSPSELNARMLAIFEWLLDATPEEREAWLEHTGSHEAEMAKSVLKGMSNDAATVGREEY